MVTAGNRPSATPPRPRVTSLEGTVEGKRRPCSDPECRGQGRPQRAVVDRWCPLMSRRQGQVQGTAGEDFERRTSADDRGLYLVEWEQLARKARVCRATNQAPRYLTDSSEPKSRLYSMPAQAPL
jgi:hypothetical protein